jgi:tetratricopeptide (TPR) repeat protein
VLLLVGAALGAAGVSSPAGADPTEEEGGAGGDPDYAEGKSAIERADWPRAVALLAAAARRDARNPDIHNYLRFAYRHAGDFAAAFAHYDEAPRLNPRHRGAHEYAGEAALLADNLPRAEHHLAASSLRGRSLAAAAGRPDGLQRFVGLVACPTKRSNEGLFSAAVGDRLTPVVLKPQPGGMSR